MSAEEQIKAAIVVFPDAISYASPELNGATEVACRNLNKFVDYVQTLEDVLKVKASQKSCKASNHDPNHS